LALRPRSVGPGILLAATAIGGSHLVLCTTAGASFGYRLLWLIVLAHLLKYHAFEFGPRLAVVTGHSLLSAYRRLPGPRDWALWVGLIDMVLESVGVLAAVAGLTGSILQAAFGGLGLGAWTAIVIALTFLLLVSGRYPLLRNLNLGMMIALALGTTVAFFAAPPPVTAFVRGLVPSLPHGSLLLIASILGFLPTAIGVSIWQSLWTLEDPRFNGSSPDDSRSTRERLRAVLVDLRAGYLLSAILAVFFLGLGAAVLHPRGLVPGQFDLAATLARLYTELFGGWMRPLFYAVAFFTTFSTTYAIMDGMPRTLVATVRHLRSGPVRSESIAAASSLGDSERRDTFADPERPDRGRLYWSYLVAMTVLSVGIVRAVPDPVFLLTLLGAITFVFSPLYYLLNTWAVTHLIADPALRPSRAALGLARVGIAFLVVVAGLLIYAQLLR
jgi:Mn2+/Fe2+ NRAMP family transporter